MQKVIEFRVLLREEVSSNEHLKDIEQMAEQLKDAIYDSDPHSTYISDVFYVIEETDTDIEPRMTLDQSYGKKEN